MTTITKERIELFIKSPLENGLTRGEQMELARIALASLDAESVSQTYKLPEEKGASLQLRNLIRKRHAEWSDSTFGNVGPVGPLKHLSKEALEAAAEPGDLSEWADMQFLLWDAQRRAGITDEQIALAMVEKLVVNKKREWPEPKDGEPRLHIKEQSAPAIPDDWVSCSERMPEDEQEVIVQNKLGYRYVSYFDEHSGLFFDMPGGNQVNCIEHILVTHWMPLPAPPQH
ncbi:DUF550 domain-containing protein [Salmonella enterica]|nr:DUF550 domain-containing protein [Salmonella enterica]EAW4328920.1 DUF550 domain-containing protein [Salmonella enterica]EFR5201631.1 DUF550 domain-containing protein [Salmonella enterica]EFR5307932.1 DUF550 domain-containing protein [Salmonella enterica]EFR5601848.1 DUF550 domain-containing protein [Salmonella enterica]